MSDIKVMSLKNKKNCIISPVKNVQKCIEKNIFELLGLRLIASNYVINDLENEVIQTLAIDDNYQLVIIEYRFGKFERIINKGLYYIDYIIEHLSSFKILLRDVLKEDAKYVNYCARLIVIGDDFNKYDEYAIKQMRYTIDLIKCKAIDDEYIILEKNYQSKIVDMQNSRLIISDDLKDIVNSVKEYILSLGDEVCCVGCGEYLVFRKIKTFCYISITNNQVYISLYKNNKYVKKAIKSFDSFEKMQKEIEKVYDAN